MAARPFFVRKPAHQAGPRCPRLQWQPHPEKFGSTESDRRFKRQRKMYFHDETKRGKDGGPREGILVYLVVLLGIALGILALWLMLG